MKRKLIMLLSTTAFIIFMLSICSVTTFAGDKWESEPNDEYSDYTLTLEDNNNYGYISGDTDMDVWKTFFFRDGYANFWLGNIPSGCDYALIVMNEEYSVLGCSDTSMAKQQLLSLNVEAGKYYYIVILATDGSYSETQAYKMRAFCYPDYTISSVPLYMQEKTDTCNMACARMILASYGVYVSENDCLTRANIICNAYKEYGYADHTYVWVINDVINYYLSANNKSTTFKYTCISSMSSADYTSLVAQNIKRSHPIIAQIKPTASSTFGYDSNGHYVVIKGTNHDSSLNYYAVVNDPHYNYCKTLRLKMSEMRTLLLNHANRGYIIYALDR